MKRAIFAIFLLFFPIVTSGAAAAIFEFTTELEQVAPRSFWLELLPGESVDQISFTAERQLALSEKTEYFNDLPTSESGRYDNVISSATAEQIFSSPLIVESETQEIGGRQFARITFFPVSVDANGRTIFNQKTSILLNGRTIDKTALITASELDSLHSDYQPKTSADVTSTASPTEMLIVTSAESAGAMQRLADYRTTLGITTEVIDIADIIPQSTGTDDAERLRNYLIQFYNDGGKYLILAGDETILPVRLVHHLPTATVPEPDQLILCDLYFADLDSDWDPDHDQIFGERDIDLSALSPELLVGRLPFNKVQEFDSYIDKLITYETNPGNGNRNYLTKAFFFTADQMRDYPTVGQYHAIAQSYPNWFALDTMTGVEQMTGDDPSPTCADANGSTIELSTGYGIVNIVNHGRHDGFSMRSSGYNGTPRSNLLSDLTTIENGAVENLARNNMSSFYYSLACDNGGFDLDQPEYAQEGVNFAQALLSLDSAGAVGMVANSRWGWVNTSYIVQQSFFEELFAHPHEPASRAMYRAQAANYFYRDLVYGQLYFGDPTTHVYTLTPRTIAIHISPVYDGLEIAVNSAGSPLPNCTLFVSQNNLLLAEGVTDAAGTAVVSLSLQLGDIFKIAAKQGGFVTTIKDYQFTMATDIDDDNSNLPTAYALNQNYPNPFNPSTTISFDLPERSNVRLEIYNLLGQKIATLIDQTLAAGEYKVAWGGKNSAGQPIASGIYIYRLLADDFLQTKKMLLLK